jgi:hypothetical protein
MLSCIDFSTSVFNVYDLRITVKLIQTLAHALERFISSFEYRKNIGVSLDACLSNTFFKLM